MSHDTFSDALGIILEFYSFQGAETGHPYLTSITSVGTPGNWLQNLLIVLNQVLRPNSARERPRMYPDTAYSNWAANSTTPAVSEVDDTQGRTPSSSHGGFTPSSTSANRLQSGPRAGGS
jgi:hypothetical protein